WICGRTVLPSGWSESCVLGIICLCFFLLPLAEGEHLGVQIYGDRKVKRKRRTLQIGKGKDHEWPPEQIIHYYGPATWAKDGSWGDHTPIYMLNRIIRLQAVVEIITNETARALNLPATQQTKMHNAIHQNRVALDYLLASEGGVCGKFNLSNCCLQIDDEGKVIEEITDRMRKVAHVPVQTWNG
ncbi:ENR1 protein, partial [Crocuta crocuta]